MDQNGIELFARQRNLSRQDAVQMFLQVIVLKNLSHPQARLIGGGALVFGHENTRFSEDVDLTSVLDPALLKPGLVRAAAEIERWFNKPVLLHAPKPGKRTWWLVCRLGPSESIQLHVDSQPYRAYTQKPLVIEFPSIPGFVCSSLEIDELMAEKILAVAGRRYLGGRDLFDLWFHWFRKSSSDERAPAIIELVKKKLKERGLTLPHLHESLHNRLLKGVSLERAQTEWRRYLPADFQRSDIFGEILSGCRRLPGLFS